MSPEPTATGAASPDARPSRLARRIVLWISRRCLGWFYREYRVIGAERIPASGAVLLIGNHPNDLPDVLLGYLTTARTVRYVATVSAANSWLSAKTYAWLGVIPVTRIRDARAMRAQGVDIMAVNRAATERVAGALAAGELVGAFPEGGVRVTPTLAEFRTGVASMVLKAFESGATNDINIVPFGNQYEAPTHPGSDAIVMVGAPVSLRAWMASTPDADRGAAGLTRACWEAVRAVTRNAATWELAGTRDRIVAVAAAMTLPADPLAAAPALLARAGVLAEDGAEGSVRLRTDVEALADAVERAGGIATSAVDHGRLLMGLGLQADPAPASLLRLAALAPFAAIGAAVHAPVWWYVWRHARTTAASPAEHALLAFVPGLFFVAGWYLLCALFGTIVLTLLGQAAWWALTLLVMLPRLGDAAMAWRHAYRGRRLVSRVRNWPETERSLLCAAFERVRAVWGA